MTRIVDQLAARRLLRQASVSFALTREEEVALRSVTRGPLNVRLLRNGIDVGSVPVEPLSARAPRPEVLFCARLHPRKRVMSFAEMAIILLRRGLNAQFTVAGPDEGDLPRLRELIEREGAVGALRYIGPLSPEKARQRLAAADVFVLPSVNEPFPMTVLEAMSAGTPCVISDTCMIADDLKRREAAVVTDGSAHALADAVGEILRNAAWRNRVASLGQATVADSYSIGAVVDDLEDAYGEAASAH
jgi:glycosyltransferase involved in cell wall biosynthesis